ncbi:hypothetical protein [Rhodohalobacter sp. 614A]|uniref:hypothetical protein n=1 Tax=Rhodohalobacter sp. 614A TaxID=2908649 RepID=UPI001F3AFFAA|nr:hypothetical protein [Rhodohalobacter sp. 614A]
MQNLILIANIFSSFALSGLIWCVQMVHYPFFLRSDQVHFVEHIAFHKNRISLIVAPLMILELVTSGILSFQSETHTGLNIFGFVVVILIWLVTFSVQVPLHGKLSNGYDEQTIQKLIQTNWIRTFLWTVKSFSSLYLLNAIMP